MSEFDEVQGELVEAAQGRRVDVVHELHLHYAQRSAAGCGPEWRKRADELEDAVREELGVIKLETEAGGSAFPWVSESGDMVTTDTGMTVRQWYAGMALQGLCARMDNERFMHLVNGHSEGEDFVKVARVLADTMLAEDGEGL